jgi:Xaa-Pro aminopeptidase
MQKDFTDKLKEVQNDLNEQAIDGWLFYDFRGSNILAYRFLEIASDKFFSRRFFYWIPKRGEPIKIVSLIEPYGLDHLPGLKWTYRTWEELEKFLFEIALPQKKIAMEYSPENAIPVVSKVDAGTIELVQKKGAQVVSSANLMQKYTSVWSSEQLHSHIVAADVLCDVIDLTWKWISESFTTKNALNEYQVQQFMQAEIAKRDCICDHPPICAVNAHSADPHYAPAPNLSTPICPGDFILLDAWCKQNHPGAVYADIARVAVAASQPTPKQNQVFTIVKQARDLATEFIRSHYEKNIPLQGWQVDQVCRDYIAQMNYEEFFIHRTGHNIGEEVHGAGANLDNFETHDCRTLLPGTCFSVEPGIYLPNDFGVRLEYDIYLDVSNQIKITGGIQTEIICLRNC